MEKLVSVIMGVYNSKNLSLLRRSINSILNQTYKNIEIIICNDASTNIEVNDILNEYANKYNNVILLENEVNRGLAYSLNRCIQVSRGFYIARQDDDDISLSTRIEKQVNFLERQNEYVLVGCNLILFDETGNWGIRKHKETPKKSDFLYGNQFPHPATVIKKDVLLSIGSYTSSKITRRTEDYDLYMRLYYNGYTGYNIQENLYYYFENKQNYAQQKLKYRFDEAKLKFYWFKRLKLMPIGLIYCIKPIVSGLTPRFIKKKIKRKLYGVKNQND